MTTATIHTASPTKITERSTTMGYALSADDQELVRKLAAEVVERREIDLAACLAGDGSASNHFEEGLWEAVAHDHGLVGGLSRPDVPEDELADWKLEVREVAWEELVELASHD